MKKLCLIILLALSFTSFTFARDEQELSNIDAFINTKPFKLADYVGNKVVLLDFWTYSCINCIRTFPYLNAWWDKYKDYGLVIVGVHTPEFDFEKKVENVEMAAKKYHIMYPIAVNNNHSVWNEYGNLYWPREALIDVDGNIIYRHVGEGNYDETERQIQAALAARAKKLGLNLVVPAGTVQPKLKDTVDFKQMQSPETYFGVRRNEYLANGRRFAGGTQVLSEPAKVVMNQLYLVGKWDFSPEFATNVSGGAKIIYPYGAKEVYLVASARQPLKISIARDGQWLKAREVGQDVTINKDGTSTAIIKEERLYKLINDPAGYGQHTIIITIEKPGLNVFTFTFG